MPIKNAMSNNYCATWTKPAEEANTYYTITWYIFPAKMVLKSEILTSSQVRDSKLLYIFALKRQQPGLGHIYQKTCTALDMNVPRLIMPINESQDVTSCSQVLWRGSSSARLWTETGCFGMQIWMSKHFKHLYWPWLLNGWELAAGRGGQRSVLKDF